MPAVYIYIYKDVPHTAAEAVSNLKIYKRLIKCLVWAAVIFPPLFLAGCMRKEDEPKRLRDIEYTVVEAEDVRPRLEAVINERKDRPFRVTYRDGEDYYAAVGYGKKPTAGYEITVEDVCETDRGILIRTSLTGPLKDSRKKAEETYPYIVLKLEYTGAEVIFEQ